MSTRPPIALTIAGSDSGGGAGIQADLKAFHAFGVYGTSAITALTAQNTLGVSAIHPVPLDNVRAQIDAVVSDLRPVAVKTMRRVSVDDAMRLRREARAASALCAGDGLSSGGGLLVTDWSLPGARLDPRDAPSLA